MDGQQHRFCCALKSFSTLALLSPWGVEESWFSSAILGAGQRLHLFYTVRGLGKCFEKKPEEEGEEQDPSKRPQEMTRSALRRLDLEKFFIDIKCVQFFFSPQPLSFSLLWYKNHTQYKKILLGKIETSLTVLGRSLMVETQYLDNTL